MLSSIYDPLGLISPFILQGRRIIQELCQGKLDWDERVSDDLAELWEKWRSNISSLSKMRVQRCYKPLGFGKAINASLHYFTDEL